jgi:hypothetical protein
MSVIGNWATQFINHRCHYFARHSQGEAVEYNFNSRGFRGPEFYNDPDISVIGSSFSFGVGLDWSQCWHQNLGNYRVNCYSAAGVLVTNNDILEYYYQTQPKGIVILQFREQQYDRAPWAVPTNTKNFIIEPSGKHDTIPTFTYGSFLDRSWDAVHPGQKTHRLWSKWIKTLFNL